MFWTLQPFCGIFMPLNETSNICMLCTSICLALGSRHWIVDTAKCFQLIFFFLFAFKSHEFQRWSFFLVSFSDELSELGVTVHGHIFNDIDEAKTGRPTLPVFPGVDDQEEVKWLPLTKIENQTFSNFTKIYWMQTNELARQEARIAFNDSLALC